MFRMAIIGVGKISRRAMIPAVRGARTAELAALGTSSPEKAARLAEEYGVPKCYAGYQELLDDPEIDGVYIGLPNHLHKPWTLRALASGKHVLCDKPLGMNYGEAREMNDAARSAGRLLMEAFMYRFHPQHAFVRRLIDDGTAGPVRLFQAHFSYYLEEPNNIRMKPEMGGGGLWDVGCYGIDSARFLFEAEPTACFGTWMIGRDSGVDEFCHFTLQFPGGRVAAVSCAMHMLLENTYSVKGENGTIRVPRAYLPDMERPPRVLVTTDRGETEHEVPVTNQYAEEIDAFAAACGGKQDARIGGGLENMRILDAVAESCRSGQAQRIG